MASTSVKNGTGATPFDQIHAKEVSENERVARELAVFERERQDVQNSAREMEERGEQEAREAARASLKEAKENEISALVQKAEIDAEAACTELEAKSRARQPKVVASLVEQASSEKLFTLAA